MRSSTWDVLIEPVAVPEPAIILTDAGRAEAERLTASAASTSTDGGQN